METVDRVAVITGASRGLGAGLAARFAERGLRLGLCARTVPPSPAGDSKDVVAEAVDVTDPDTVAAFCERVTVQLGPIDLWVNNAGLLEPIDPVRDIDPVRFADLLAVNVGGVLHGSRAYVRHVRSRPGGGVLVNITSGAALRATAGWAAYSASKAAVDRITEAVAEEEAGTGLRAIAVAPGVVDTDMQATIRDTPAERFPRAAEFVERKREGRFNTAGYVADHLLALAFDPIDPARPTDEVVVRLPEERH